MRVAITGASGLIGTALTRHLVAGGHEVIPMVRQSSTGSRAGIAWSPREDFVDLDGLEGVDAVVHLAGEPIGARRWNPDVKRRILESRTTGTDVLARGLARMQRPPAVLVSASAIGIYGDRGDEVLTEASPAGDGFLSQVCVAWEAAAAPAAAAGIRVVHPRTGVVLTASGGALRRMLLPFRLGVGGRIGSGRQYFSWISLQDHVRAMTHLLTSELAGPVNLTGPQPVDNADFTKALGRALHRPTVVPVPAALLRLALGEMGKALVLDSARVTPTKLTEDGFSFQHANVDEALAWALAN